MEYRKLGNSELELPVITLGTWAIGSWMWGKTDRKDAIEAITTSIQAGVTAIDTAPIYGQGESEEIVGEAIQNVPRDQVQILTKFGMLWDRKEGEFAFKSKDNQGNDIEIYKYAGKESIIKECEDSLRRLKTDYIDLYQIHWPDNTTVISETFEAVQQLIDQGKVRYGGVCNYNEQQMAEALQTMPIVSDQIPFSMVTRDDHMEAIHFCIENGLGVLAYSPMEGGLLTGKIRPGHKFAEGDHRQNSLYFTDEYVTRVDEFLKKLQPLADDKKATLSQIVLKWTVLQPGITVALAGARNADQAIKNAAAADVALDPAELDFISSLVDGLL